MTKDQTYGDRVGVTGPYLLAGLVVLLGLVAILHLAAWSEIGDNGDWYLRNATYWARGEIPRSRYSAGFSVLLAPLVWITGDELATLTRAGNLLVLALTLAGLVALFFFLRIYVSPWVALGLVAIPALGQGAAHYFTGIEVEPLTLLLVTGFLLSLVRGHSWAAVALTGAAALVRVAVVPFFAVVWILFLRRSRYPAASALVVLGLGIVAHLAVGSDANRSYVDIQVSTYEAEGGGGRLSGLIAIVAKNVANYARFGVPAILVPSRVLRSPFGLPVALAIGAVLALGLWSLVRRRTEPISREWFVLMAACVAFLAYLVAVLVWPIRPSETVRLVLPFAAVPLLAAASGLMSLTSRMPSRSRSTVLIAALGVTVLVSFVGGAILAWEGLGNANSRDAYVSALEGAQSRLPEGAILARFPALTELATGRRSAFLDADDAMGLDRLANRVGACSVIVESGEGSQASALEWAASRQWPVLGSSGASTVFALTVERCLEKPPAVPSG